jgi:uncharacterized membrane protein
VNEAAPKAPRLTSDFQRLLVSAAIGAAGTAVTEATYLAIFRHRAPVNAIVVAAYVFSSLASLAYFITTFAVFQDATPETLRRWLAESAPTGRLPTVQASLAGTGPNIPAQWSVLAIGSVVVLVFDPRLLNQPWMLGMSVAVVTTSWLVTVVAYSVHYARITATVGGLTFSGDNGVVFWDCVYLAMQVQTTFSSSDVGIDTTLTRRVITGHTLISFAFNSVIIALLISVLLLGRG